MMNVWMTALSSSPSGVHGASERRTGRHISAHGDMPLYIIDA